MVGRSCLPGLHHCTAGSRNKSPSCLGVALPLVAQTDGFMSLIRRCRRGDCRAGWPGFRPEHYVTQRCWPDMQTNLASSKHQCSALHPAKTAARRRGMLRGGLRACRVSCLARPAGRQNSRRKCFLNRSDAAEGMSVGRHEDESECRVPSTQGLVLWPGGRRAESRDIK